MDDITFCMKGWDGCGIIRCERHPHNITDKSIPHSYADLYQTGYCPIGKLASKTKEMVEVVRCKDCLYWDETDIHSTQFPNNRRCKGTFGKLFTEADFYCAYGVRKDG